VGHAPPSKPCTPSSSSTKSSSSSFPFYVLRYTRPAPDTPLRIRIVNAVARSAFQLYTATRANGAIGYYSEPTSAQRSASRLFRLRMKVFTILAPGTGGPRVVGWFLVCQCGGPARKRRYYGGRKKVEFAYTWRGVFVRAFGHRGERTGGMFGKSWLAIGNGVWIFCCAVSRGGR
jgi:hypothetical protein